MRPTLPVLLLPFLFAASSVRAEPVFGSGFETTFESPLACSNRGFGDHTVDAQSALVVPQFRLNGGAWPVSAAHYGRIALHSTPLGTVELGATHQPPTPKRVLKGLYGVFYHHQSGSLVPGNDTALLTQVEIAADGELIVDVPMRVIEPQPTLNGVPFPASDYEDGELVLDGESHLGRVVLGSSRAPIPAMRLIPGTYRARFRRESGGTIVPANGNGWGPRVSVSESGPLALSFHATAAAIEFRFNGAPAPASIYDQGDLELVGFDGDRIALGSSRHQFTERRLMPGHYRARWSRQISNGVAPFNTDALLTEPLVVGEAPTSLVIDVPVAYTSGDFSLDGAAPPASIYQQGRLLVRDPHSGEQIELAHTSEGEYERPLVAATYEVLYDHVAGAQVPQNRLARIDAAWNTALQPQRSFALSSYPATLRATLNGQPFGTSPMQLASFALRDMQTGAVTPIGQTDVTEWPAVMLAGNYDARYASVSGGSAVPVNGNARVPRNLRFSSTTAGQIITTDILAGLLTLRYAHNGQPLPTDPLQASRFFLEGPDELLLWAPSDAPVQTRFLVQQRYRVFLAHQAGEQVPQNDYAELACWDLASP